MKRNQKKQDLPKAGQKNREKIPVHIAIIPDGNRRWAKKRGLPTLVGHKKGLYNGLLPIVEACSCRGVKYLTFYCFSTENWNRSKKEIDYLMRLFEEVFKNKVKELHRDNIKINVIGDVTRFSSNIQKLIVQAKDLTRNNSGLTVNFALNYGSRDETARAVRKIVSEKISSDKITPEIISSHLDTAGQPDPDILIRTSGEKRISNYLLWQLAYTELYFTDIMWPDFGEKELDKALREYDRRKRNFGK